MLGVSVVQKVIGASQRTFLPRLSAVVVLQKVQVQSSQGTLDRFLVRQKSTAPQQQEMPHLMSMRERGLYNDTVKSQLRRVQDIHVQTLNVSENGKYLDVVWDDGHKSQFHALWLRHSCHCPECRVDHNGMITVDFGKLDLDLKILSATMEGEEVIVFKWQDRADGTTHEGPIPAAWLRQYCYSEKAQQEIRSERAMTFFEDKTVPEVEYEEIEASEIGVYKWLKHLSERGICLLKNVPCEIGMVAKMAEKIAPIQHSIYGETFDVVSTPEPINAAYSPVKLALHMDQTHYESPPGLQMLHCIQFDPNIVGGDNTFADIHEIANKMRELKPELFERLTRIPMTNQTVHYSREYPVHLVFQRPMFTLNHRDELVSVVWHPMLEGPIQTRPEDVEPYYEAYKYFYTLVNTYKSIYKLRMVNGDLISFNNRRVLHGRASYTNQKGLRFLQGTYVEISEFQSRVQVLNNKYGDGRAVPRCGSFDWR